MVTVPVTHVEYTWNLVVPWHHSWTGLHDVIESIFVYDIIVWDKIIWHHWEYFCTCHINLENIHSNDPYKTESSDSNFVCYGKINFLYTEDVVFIWGTKQVWPFENVQTWIPRRDKKLMIFYLDESLEGEKCPGTVPEFRERPGTEEKGIQEES